MVHVFVCLFVLFSGSYRSSGPMGMVELVTRFAKINHVAPNKQLIRKEEEIGSDFYF